MSLLPMRSLICSSPRCLYGASWTREQRQISPRERVDNKSAVRLYGGAADGRFCNRGTRDCARNFAEYRTAASVRPFAAAWGLDRALPTDGKRDLTPRTAACGEEEFGTQRLVRVIQEHMGTRRCRDLINEILNAGGRTASTARRSLIDDVTPAVAVKREPRDEKMGRRVSRVISDRVERKRCPQSEGWR